MSSEDSPHSEKVDAVFSTPVPGLDDHRLQPRALPRNDISPVRAHVPTPSVEVHVPTPRMGSIDPVGLLQVNDALRDGPYISRDFEHVIIDDDRSVVNHEIVAPPPRRGSVRERERRMTTRQPRPQLHERVDRSRESSSSRSTSPPNSVEAFADPRRRERANTLDSKAPSFTEVVRHRTYSAGTHQRRGTLSNASLVRVDAAKGEDEPEVDVCFLSFDENGKTYKIDYEELEEFVALSNQGKILEAIPESVYGMRKSDSSSDAKIPKVFHDVRHGMHHSNTSRIVMNCDDPSETPLEQLSSADTPTKGYSDQDEKILLAELCEKKPAAERFCLFSSEAQSTVHGARLGDLVGNGTTFRDLFELGPDGGVWWLDVRNPTKEEVGALSRAFRIHPLTTEDILTQEAREKVELFSQYYFVCFRTFYNDRHSEDFLEPVNIYIVVSREGILSFSFSDNPHAKSVRKRIGKLRDYVSLGSDWICYAMIDDIVDSFGPVIRDAEHESENIEDQVFIAREDDYIALLRQIGECRKRVLNMMRLLGGKADVIKGFAKRCNEQYSVAPRGDIGLYLGDIQDHVVTMMSNLGHVEKMLSRSHGNYLAQLNVDNLMRGNHANKVLSKITLVATIMVPLNLICGLFGMNVNVPGKDAGGLGWFFGIIGVIAAIVVFSLLLARRMKWI